MDLQQLPQDVIDHIGQYYITKQMKLQCRIDKLEKKVEKLEKRSIDEWIEHLKVSKRYSIKNIEIINDRIHFINSWGDRCNCNKNEIINQGYISHVRHLYRWYTQRIMNASTPAPQYVGETFTNIVGENMIAELKEYGDYPYHRCLVFIQVKSK